jgi:hypothetical protein
MRNEFYTDYPITELGDEPNKEAPIRACTIVQRYDRGSKYVLVNVGGVEKEIKKGYIYTEPGRLGDVPAADRQDLEND